MTGAVFAYVAGISAMIGALMICFRLHRALERWKQEQRQLLTPLSNPRHSQ
jgi:hypothetical protein